MKDVKNDNENENGIQIPAAHVMYTCPECSKKFHSEAEYKMHYASVHNSSDRIGKYYAECDDDTKDIKIVFSPRKVLTEGRMPECLCWAIERCHLNLASSPFDRTRHLTLDYGFNHEISRSEAFAFAKQCFEKHIEDVKEADSRIMDLIFSDGNKEMKQ